MSKNGYNHFSRQVWRGFFVFAALLVMQGSANPSVGYSIKKSSGNYIVTIYGKSIGSIRSGDIYCKYDPQYDIDKVSLSSPLTALSLGASLNRSTYSLHIIIATTGSVTIDSAAMAILDIPFLDNISDNYGFKIDSVSFLDRSGVKHTADIIPVSITAPLHSAKKTIVSNSSHYYMLNGKMVSQARINNYKRESIIKFIPLKVR